MFQIQLTMTRILVPIDFSEISEFALQVAVQIAEKQNSIIYILHSVEMPQGTLGAASNSELPESLFFIKLVEKRFETLLKVPYLQNARTEEIIGNDAVFNDVNHVIEKHDIDLVIMGSHGQNGIKEFFIGSNTEKVVRTAKVPVLVIKKAHPTFEVSEIVFASDLELEGQAAFKQILEFANFFKSACVLLHINTPGQFRTSSEIASAKEKFLDGISIPESFKFVVYQERTTEKGILEYSRAQNVALIAMATHGRKGLAHFFNGSISEELVSHAQRPVLTVKI